MDRSEMASVPPACQGGQIEQEEAAQELFPASTPGPRMHMGESPHTASALGPRSDFAASIRTNRQGLAYSPAGQPFSPGTFSYPGQHS